MLASTSETSSAGPFLFVEPVFDFPNQGKPKAIRASENGLGDNNGRPAYYFCSQVDVFFPHLSQRCLSVCLGLRFLGCNLMQFTPCWLRSCEESSKECLPTGNRECFCMRQVTNALSLLTSDLSFLQSSFPLKLPWVICQLPELYVVSFLLL